MSLSQKEIDALILKLSGKKVPQGTAKRQIGVKEKQIARRLKNAKVASIRNKNNLGGLQGRRKQGAQVKKRVRRGNKRFLQVNEIGYGKVKKNNPENERKKVMGDLVRREGDEVNVERDPKYSVDDCFVTSIKMEPIPQLQTLNLWCEVNADQLYNLIQGPLLYLMTKNIHPCTASTFASVLVGDLYLCLCAMLYDLWRAMSGQFSIFTKMPLWYWKIRAGVMTTCRGNNTYSFYAPDDFFGPNGLYTPGVPLASDSSNGNAGNLSWYINANRDLNTAVPFISIDFITEYGPVMCTNVFSEVNEKGNEEWELCENDEERVSWFKKSIGFFIANKTTQPDSETYNWCTFYSESPINLNEYWMGCCGLCTDRVWYEGDENWAVRVGMFTYNDFKSCNGWMCWLVDTELQKTNERITVRPKYLSLEEYVNFSNQLLMMADVYKNKKQGTNNIDNSTWGASVGYNISPTVALTVAAPLVQMYAFQNSLGFDNPANRAVVCNGACWYVPVTTAPSILPRIITETVGDSMIIKKNLNREKEKRDMEQLYKKGGDPSKIQKKTVRGKGIVVYLSVLAAMGPFGCVSSQTNATVNWHDWTPELRRLMPGISVVKYEVHGSQYPALNPYIDTGPAYNILNKIDHNNAVMELSGVYSNLQGNILTASPYSDFSPRTVCYYTKILKRPPSVPMKIEKEEVRYIEKKISIGSENYYAGLELAVPSTWTPVFESDIVAIMNAYSFTGGVTIDFHRPVPISFETVPDNSGIFKENFRLKMINGDIKNNYDFVRLWSLPWVHELATVGGAEQDQRLMEFSAQRKGGGFDFLKNIVGGLPLVGPLIKDLLM